MNTLDRIKLYFRSILYKMDIIIENQNRMMEAIKSWEQEDVRQHEERLEKLAGEKVAT